LRHNEELNEHINEAKEHLENMFTLVGDYINQEQLRPLVTISIMGALLAYSFKVAGLTPEEINRACSRIDESTIENN
jgi:predicted TIM-barrel enzyme